EAQGRIDPASSAPTRICLAHPVGSRSPGTPQLTGERAHLDNSGSTASYRTGFEAASARTQAGPTPSPGPDHTRLRPHAGRANAVARPGSNPPTAPAQIPGRCTHWRTVPADPP